MDPMGCINMDKFGSIIWPNGIITNAAGRPYILPTQSCAEKTMAAVPLPSHDGLEWDILE